mgnify:CR=1 FL=1
MGNRRIFAGIDIGGTKCAVILAAADENDIVILKKERFATQYGGDPYAIIERFCGILTEFEGVARFESIGVSCGGPLDSATGVIKRPPNLPSWDEVPVCTILRERFGVPAKLRNDADACAVAEWRYGAGRGCDSMVFLTFGTGLGAGLILGGRLYSGSSDRAGEIGHVRAEAFGPSGYGKPGSFEGFCSGGGIAQLGYTIGLARYQNGERPSYWSDDRAAITAKTIADAADAGDSAALETYAVCGQRLGQCLSVLIDVLDPQRIVLGGIYPRSTGLLLPHILPVIERECLPGALERCNILPARLSEQIGDYAAVCIAMED